MTAQFSVKRFGSRSREKFFRRGLVLAGLVGATVLSSVTQSRAQAAYDFTIVVDNTFPGFESRGFGAWPTITDDGTVSFVVDMVGAYRAEEGKAIVRVGDSITGGAFINKLGEIVARRDFGAVNVELYKVTSAGVDVPLAQTGTKFRNFGTVHLSPNGIAVFPGTENPISPRHYGIYTASGDGTTSLVVDNLGIFGGFGGSPSINSAGKIAFTGYKDTVNNVTGEAGLYVGTVGGNGVTKTVLVQDNTLYKFDGAPHINDAGQIALKAYEASSGEPCILVVNEDGTDLRIVARSGGIGGDGAYSMLESPIINEVGSVVFYGRLDTGGRGIFTGPDPTVDKVVEIGDPLFGSTLTSAIFNRGLNNKNGIAFYFELADGRSGIARAKLGSIAAPEMRKEGNSVTLTVDSISGTRIYQLQASTSSASEPFVDLGPAQSAPAGTKLTFTDTPPAGSVRFYRVKISTYR